MKRTPKSRPPIARFQRIAQLIISANESGRHIFARDLAAELEVDLKTVYRDLDFLRDGLGLPLVTDGRNLEGSGFYFTRPVHLCPLCTGIKP